MTKGKTAGAASRGKAGAAKVVLTEEQQKHQAQLAEIKKAATVPAAYVQWTDLRKRVDALWRRKEELEAENREQDKLRNKAAQAQDYVAAQTHKERQEAIQKETLEIIATLEPLQELTAAANAHHTEMFLADERAPYNQKESVTLYRIQVINPVTKNSEAVHFLESCDTVQVHLDGQSFSSEAYHLATWAEENGFVVRRDERPIEF